MSRSKQPVIFAESLTRVYSMGSADVVALNGIDLTIFPGEMVVLKGNSGSGKSTLLSILAGLDSPTAGELVVAGRDLDNSSPEELTRFRRDVVGMVFQSFNLLPTLNVMENVCLPALLAGKSYAAVRKKAEALLGWMDMTDRIEHVPARLSGGEMQRTAIARSLINDPEVILADEPTGNLDSRNGEIVIRLLSDLNRRWGRTIIVATHSTLADSFATTTICLKDGIISGPSCDM